MFTIVALYDMDGVIEHTKRETCATEEEALEIMKRLAARADGAIVLDGEGNLVAEC